MTATSHRIFNLSAGIALSFHWWVWLLFLLAASLPDQLEPATRRQSRFRSHRGLFHTYSVWILLGLTIFWIPTSPDWRAVTDCHSLRVAQNPFHGVLAPLPIIHASACAEVGETSKAESRRDRSGAKINSSCIDGSMRINESYLAQIWPSI
jgi:hypothetical protein